MLMEKLFGESEIDTNLTTAIYCRVSKKEQLEGYSLEEQIRICKEYIKARGYFRYRVYREKGQSGRTLNRPELQKMLYHIKEGKIDLVIVWKLNRLSRNFLDSLILISELDAINVSIISLTEKIDTSTIIGKIVLSILMGFSQIEVENLSDNIKMGLKARAKEGKWNGGITPLGYKYQGKDKLIIDRNEAEVIKLIFKKYIKYQSIRKVTNDLNRNKAPNRNDNRWNDCTVRYIIDNEIYNGKLIQCGITVKDESLRIVSKRMFKTAQEKRNQARRFSTIFDSNLF